MGGELVTVASPPQEEKYSEKFYELEAFYIAIGMTYEQYWDGDSTMVQAYRKAYDLKKKQVNEEAWLHGMYIYEAIGCMSPILNANAKRGTKAKSYPQRPHEMTPPPATEKEQETAEVRAYDDMQSKMEAFMTRFNKQYVEKGGDSNGRE